MLSRSIFAIYLSLKSKWILERLLHHVYVRKLLKKARRNHGKDQLGW